jgi:hypothetical protein
MGKLLENIKLEDRGTDTIALRWHLRTLAGRAIDQAVNCRIPLAAARVGSQVIWDMWCEKCHWRGFPPSTSVSLAISNSMNRPTLINIIIIFFFFFIAAVVV